eukprot:scaffold1402_cov403-Prasinococcus_capsulatus_cf.AAC.3
MAGSHSPALQPAGAPGSPSRERERTRVGARPWAELNSPFLPRPTRFANPRFNPPARRRAFARERPRARGPAGAAGARMGQRPLRPRAPSGAWMGKGKDESSSAGQVPRFRVKRPRQRIRS